MSENRISEEVANEPIAESSGTEVKSLDSSSTNTHEAPNTFDGTEDASYHGMDEDPERALSNEDGQSLVESTPDMNRIISRMITQADDYENQEYDESEIPKMGGGRPLPPRMAHSREIYAVSFDGPDDPIHPHNWPTRKKVLQCINLATFVTSMVFGSSIYSAGTLLMSEVYHVAPVVITLGLSLYVLGFASGPIIWGPLSEIYGRKPILIISCIGFTCFHFAVATAENLQTMIICRFFAGFIGAAPLAAVPASFADTFDNNSRGTALMIFSMTIFCAPLLGPIVGSFVAYSYLGYRWLSYLVGILGSFSLITITFFCEETHHPIILVEKAKKLRRMTGNWGIHAPHEEFSLSFKEIVERNITRPLRMMVSEPILFFVSIYNGVIYGILYLFLSAYPIIFSEGYQINPPGVADLTYIGLLIGVFIGGIFSLWMEKKYKAVIAANGGKIIPEARLPTMCYGGVVFPIGIFWLCWSGNYPNSVPWIVPTLSGLCSGFGLVTIFIPSLNYVVDSYLFVAASAISANTFIRSSFGAAFPLFAEYLFHNLGTNWAGTLLGCISLVMAPIPFLFAIYGKRLRQKSKFSYKG